MGGNAMKTEYSYQEIASNFHLWQVYADPSGHTSEAWFNDEPVEHKIAFLEHCFGAESDDSENELD